MWVVLIALRRPYTFVVLALLIAIFGTLSAVRTPVDIFPNINIPVISVVWTYNGLLPNDMSGRVVYYYERTLTSQVGDIEHIDSQSLDGYGVVKIFFQKNVDIAAALAQVTAASQTVLKLLPPGITPPYVLSYNAADRADPAARPVEQAIAADEAVRPRAEFYSPAACDRRRRRGALALWRQGTASADRPRPGGDAGPQRLGGRRRQRPLGAEPGAARRETPRSGKFDWNVALNASPMLLDRINDLPVKKVNGTIIYIRDVAYVHDGSPPQTNFVRVNGARAVLMTILKAGSTSTLNVIDGVKSVLPRVEASLPSGLDLHAVGDQSVFVKAAVYGVIREAGLAAGLVGLMILLFLGSWRSTVIILIEIPLAILFSLTALSWLGETINVMTLGGLALAVGILVDDGTVTIENINCHLEQGKEIEPAILDGARQIVIPAFVTLLCICIVFVPMFELSGVAGYLFRPLAEAVVFALIGSFTLSRTLVSTMAYYLLRGGHGGHGRIPAAIRRPSRRTRNPLKRFQEGFETRFARFRDATARPGRSRSADPRRSSSAFLVVVLLSLGLSRFSARISFRPSIPDRSSCMCVPRPAPVSRRRRGFATSWNRPYAASSRPPRSITSSTTSGCLSAASTWPTATPAPSGRRMPTC